MSRGGRFYRRELLEELTAAGVGEVISVEGPKVSYDIEPLSRELPAVRFLLLQGEASPGERINLAMGEARSRAVLVLWTDMKLSRASGLEVLAGRMEERGLLCLVPELRNPGGEIMPTVQLPALIRGRLQVIPWAPKHAGMRSVFPFDYCGLYSKERFQLCGGFDPWIRTPYWQKLDFGLRASLWGETIAADPSFQVAYTAEQSPEENTPDWSYKLFYLKNMAIRFNGEMGVLSRKRFLAYALRSGSGLLEAIREFREIQQWVWENRFRFKSDVSSLVGHWEVPE
ncbi:MAG: hypothetical protein JW820_08425 [Spirochaetales bacterium]|nr:hypothetical protein [Spirochaetales bacterium]